MGRLDLPDKIRDEDIYITQPEHREEKKEMYADPAPTSVFRLIESLTQCVCVPDCSNGCPLD